jgi:hypothetical protein
MGEPRAARPHMPGYMPVWAVWTGAVLWFSSSRRSVKATAYEDDFLDPAANASMRLRPEKDFTRTPTRWTFP